MRETRHYIGLALCTDRWFDPVAGQDNPVAGEMAAVRPINNFGVTGCKAAHTLRGLAMQGYDWATPAQAAAVRRWVDDREALLTEWRAGGISDEAARLKAKPWATLMRQLGLEA